MVELINHGVYLLNGKEVIFIYLILGNNCIFNLIAFGFLLLNNSKFFKTAYHIKSERFTFSQKHNRLVPKVFLSVVIIKSANSVSCVSDTNLRDLVVVTFINQIAVTGAVDSGNALNLGKERTRDHISRHSGKIFTNRTDAIRLAVAIYYFKFFTCCHCYYPLPLLNFLYGFCISFE